MLSDFEPPPVAGTCSMIEIGGRLLDNTDRDVDVSLLIKDYPRINQKQLMGLQHSLSREDLKSVFLKSDVGFLQRLWDAWQNNGISGVTHAVCSTSSTDKPMMKGVVYVCERLMKLKYLADSLSSLLPSAFIARSNEDCISQYSEVLNWKSNWIRAMVWHPNNHRLAVCQRNDYVRVYRMEEGSGDEGAFPKGPLTLRHPAQRNVSHMAWKPYVASVLAVAAENAIIVWWLDPTSVSTRPPPSSASVLKPPSNCTPVTKICWNKQGNLLFSVSPNSSQIVAWDVSKNQYSMMGLWCWGGGVASLFPSPTGTHLVSASTSPQIRVWHTEGWRDERWKNLKGYCRSVVWDPDGTAFLCTLSNSTSIYYISLLGKDSFALPIFDTSKLSMRCMDGEETEEIGGDVQQLALSPEGQRLAVTFRDTPEFAALFSVQWRPTVQLVPIGLIRGPTGSHCELISFEPPFKGSGSLLCLVWSCGVFQYLPLLYGFNDASFA